MTRTAIYRHLGIGIYRQKIAAIVLLCTNIVCDHHSLSLEPYDATYAVVYLAFFSDHHVLRDSRAKGHVYCAASAISNPQPAWRMINLTRDIRKQDLRPRNRARVKGTNLYRIFVASCLKPSTQCSSGRLIRDLFV